MIYSYSFGQENNYKQIIVGNKNDMVSQIIQSKDGGYILVGSTESDTINKNFNKIFGKSDILLAKLNKEYQLEWIKTIGTQKYESGVSVVETIDSSIIVIGNRETGNQMLDRIRNSNVVIIKLNKNGNILWERKIGTNDKDFSAKKILYVNNRILIVGNKSVNSSGRNSIFLLQLNSNGTTNWFKEYNPLFTNNVSGISIVVLNDIIIYGNGQDYNYHNDVYDGKYFIMKVNRTGTILKKKIIMPEFSNKDLVYINMNNVQKRIYLIYNNISIRTDTSYTTYTEVATADSTYWIFNRTNVFGDTTIYSKNLAPYALKNIAKYKNVLYSPKECYSNGCLHLPNGSELVYGLAYSNKLNTNTTWYSIVEDNHVTSNVINNNSVYSEFSSAIINYNEQILFAGNQYNKDNFDIFVYTVEK